ncbi:MAG: RNA polymerase sigma factor [Planctomycetes bacterium]|nr:RNA polymerase sigma factor [Planctomycetota bacterium]
MADSDERQLVDRFLRGEAAAFDQIVRLHQAGVARLAQRLLAWPDDADDVVQDVFLAALRNLGQFRGDSSLTTWLTRITINTCRSHRRRTLGRVRIWRQWVSRRPAHPDGTAGTPIEATETHEQVRRAVARLPQKEREVVVLRYLQEMAPEEIGSVLGLTTSAVNVRLHRARARLRKDLDSLT